MNATHLIHPAAEQLAAFSAGHLGEAKSAEIESHLIDCVVCSGTLEALPPDSLVALLRGEKALPAKAAAAGGATVALSCHETPCETAGAAQPPGDRNPADRDSSAPSETCLVPPSLLEHARYRVIGLLGQGGMGCVYKAEHRLMERPVALKVINQSLVNRPGLIERFRREVKAAARLTHPHIVTAYDAEQVADTHFLVMEFVEGTSLDRLVRDRGPLPVAEACDCAAQAAQGLQHAFEHGMVHRDIKPHNLMRTPEGQVKILDFGLAHFVSEVAPHNPVTELGTVMGTPDYIAPEQARDAHTADIRADIYSLGCTLYHLLAGSPPFPEGTFVQKLAAHLERAPKPLSEVRTDLPPALAQVLERMMAKDPAHRYQTPAEVVDALTAFTRLSPVPAVRPRRPWPLLVAAVLLAALGLAAYQFGPAVYRFATNRGQVVIETDDPDVQVTVKQNGELIEILDTKTNRKINLKAGIYQIELSEGKDGLKLFASQFTLERGGRQIVRVSRETNLTIQRELAVQVRKRATFRESAKLSANAFSPDGKVLVVGRVDGKVGLWDVAAGKRKSLLEAHQFEVRGVAFSPNGKTLVTAAGDWRLPNVNGEVKLWEVESGKELRVLKGHKGPVYAVAVAPDGETVASAGRLDGKVILWDLSTGKERAALETLRPVNVVAFSRDGQSVAAAGLTARLWNVRTGKSRGTLEGHDDEVHSLAFSPDGRTIATGSRDGTIKLWDAGTLRERATLKGHANWVTSVAFAPNGKVLASGDSSCFTKLWDVASGKEIAAVPAPGVKAGAWVEFSPGGDLLATLDFETTIKLWDVIPPQGSAAGEAVGKAPPPKPAALVIQPEPLPEMKPDTPLSRFTLVSRPASIKGVRSWTVETIGVRSRVLALSYVPGGPLLACASDDGQIRLWESRTGRLVRILVGSYGRLTTLACSPDGKVLACGSWEGVVQLWDIGSGRLLRTLRRQETGGVHSVAWSPDGRTLAAGCADGTLWLWDPVSGTVQDGLRGHAGPVLSVAWSPDSKRLASGSADKTVRIWDVRAGEARKTLLRHSGPVQAVAWSPDGKRLASGSEDTTVRLWEASSGTLLHTLEGKKHSIATVAWSPNGKTLASGDDENLLLWDAGSGEKLRVLVGHHHIVSSVSWSADGKTLASGSWDSTVHLWDAASGEVVRTLPGYGIRFCHAVAWSPNTRFLATGSRVNPLTLYDTQSGKAVRTLPGFSGSSLAWSPDSRTLATAPSWENGVRLWEADSGKLLHKLQGHSGDIFSLAWSPDGKTLASGSDDGTVRLWEAVSGKLLRTLAVQPPLDWGVQALAWSPDGTVLASGGKAVRLWEASSGKPLQALRGQPHKVLSLSWSPDGKTLAVGSGNPLSHWEGRLTLWSPAREQQRSLQQDDGAIHGVAWSPDGKTLASGGGWGELRVWEVGSGRLLHELSGHVSPFCSLSWSPASTLASADEHITIRLWNALRGGGTGVLVELPDARSLAVSADGHYCASPAVEEQLVYVVQTEQGQETLSPKEFGKKYGWKNDPRRVRLGGE